MGGAGARSLLRVSAVGAAAGLILVVLTGCTGDSAADDFRRAFTDDPAVAALELTSHDNQPFTGGVSGDVVARDDLPDDEVVALAARLGDYTEQHAAAMQGRVTLVADRFECEIAGEDGQDDECVSALLALREDGRATSGTISPPSVWVSTPGVDDGVSLARDLPTVLAAVAPEQSWGITIRSEDGAVNLDGMDAGRSSAVVSAWDGISAELPLTGVSSDEDEGVTFALAREADLARASDLAAQFLADTDVEVRFSSDLIQLGDSDGRAARAFLAGLDADVAASIESVWESDSRMQVTVATSRDLPGLVGPVLAGVPAEITGVELVASDDDTRVGLQPAAPPSVAWLRSLDAVLADPAVASLSLTETAVDLNVGALTDDQLARFAPDLRTLAPEGSRVCLVRIEDSICVTAADVLDEQQVNPHSRERGQAFVEAWNGV